jgi:hydroxymethylbilane synthase
LLQDPGVDALIVAKAAMDRLLGDQRFAETRDDLRAAMGHLDWMVLPLSENPNAAAQGALAIEVARTNERALLLLEKINHSASYACALREREILQEFGGGCHLALGMSVLQRTYGRIEIVKGLTPSGERIHSKKFYPHKPRPKDLQVAQLAFQSQRQELASHPSGIEAVFVSRADAWLSEATGKVIWAAGLRTWKKLAAKGVWVHGSAEALGDKENPQVDILAGRPLRWANLTHAEAPQFPGDRPCLATYKLNLQIESSRLPEAQAFEWKSASEFSLGIQKFPELKTKIHICGPGRTFESIKRILGSDQNIFVELKDEFITVI